MIGSRIVEMRHKTGWSQNRLAKELQVNLKTIKNWENDISDPSLKHIVALSKLFSVTSDYILGIDDRIVIRVEGLRPKDELCLRTICQLIINCICD